MSLSALTRMVARPVANMSARSFSACVSTACGRQARARDPHEASRAL